jgi:hypothetical protein
LRLLAHGMMCSMGYQPENKHDYRSRWLIL